MLDWLYYAFGRLLDYILDHYAIFMIITAVMSLYWTVEWLCTMTPHELVYLKVKAWRSDSTYLSADDFPETSMLPELKLKPSTAIGFSGGGARAMIGAYGFLAGLRDLGLLDKIRYMGGISGGSWGITTYLYGRFQHTNLALGADHSKGELYPEDEGEVAAAGKMSLCDALRLVTNHECDIDEDKVFLGPIVDPEDMNWEDLHNMNPSKFTYTYIVASPPQLLTLIIVHRMRPKIRFSKLLGSRLWYAIV